MSNLFFVSKTTTLPPRHHLPVDCNGVCSYILTCLNCPRQEGGVFAHTAHSVFCVWARRQWWQEEESNLRYSSGYEPDVAPFHYPAIVALMDYVPISGVSRTRLHKFGKERNFHYVERKGKEYRSFTHCRTHSKSAPLIYIPSLVFVG